MRAMFKKISRCRASAQGLSAVFYKACRHHHVPRTHWRNWYLSNIGISAVFFQIFGAPSHASDSLAEMVDGNMGLAAVFLKASRYHRVLRIKRRNWYLSNIGPLAGFPKALGQHCVLEIHWRNWHISNIGLSAVFFQSFGALSRASGSLAEVV